VTLVGSLVLVLGLASLDQQVLPPLARARDAYNAGRYDQAIALASDARSDPDTADAAAVVFARAHLERYRTALADEDLTSARGALRVIATAKLNTGDYNEYLVGLGESLYYEEAFSGAAECFSLALSRDGGGDANARERLFEWWAGALDQEAQIGPEGDRRATYQRILDRADAELRRNDRSAAATYWMAAAARGADDLERAWGAAIAGWVRAPSTGARSATLRADLDRLMTLAIVPERARRLLPSGDLQPVLQRLTGEWQSIKERWGG
jgi:tetratricopeptide (TPR) repeat protein